MYVKYYVLAIEVVYIEDDLTEIKRVHSADDKYLFRNDLEKCTLNLNSDEYINLISYTFSSQSDFIRSIQIGTTKGYLMVMEGQVELNQLDSDNSNPSIFNLVEFNVSREKEAGKLTITNNFESDQEKDKEMRTSYNKKLINQSYQQTSYKRYKKQSRGHTRHMSVINQDEKIQTIDLVKYKQRMIGLKTKFSKYLVAFDIYTEPCE